MGWRRILGLMGMYPLPRTVRTDAEIRAEAQKWEHLPEPPMVPAHQRPCTCLIYQGRRSVNVACPIHGATTPIGETT